MEAETREFTLVLNSVGEPDLYHRVGIRCELATCGQLLRGDCVGVTIAGRTSFYHKGCAPRSA
jgi:hypothetical protein